MSPDQLTRLLARMRSAADIVDAIDNNDLQRERGWDLTRWQYKMVPFGVRFQYLAPSGETSAILAVLSAGIRLAVHGGEAPASSTTIVLLD